MSIKIEKTENGTKYKNGKLADYYSIVRNGVKQKKRVVCGNKRFLSFSLRLLILFFVFTVLPVLISIGLSFTYFNVLESPDFIGWQNYVNLFFADEVFLFFDDLVKFSDLYLPIVKIGIECTELCFDACNKNVLCQSAADASSYFVSGDTALVLADASVRKSDFNHVFLLNKPTNVYGSGLTNALRSQFRCKGTEKNADVQENSEKKSLFLG